MPAAIVHGQTDDLLTLKGDNVLCSIGRLWGKASRFGACGGVECWNGSGGLVCMSVIRNPWYGYGHESARTLLDGDGFLYYLAEDSTTFTIGEYNLIKLDTSSPDPEFWKEIWCVHVGSFQKVVHLHDMCFDNLGDIIVVGDYPNEDSFDGIYLWKIDPSDGSVIWSSESPGNCCHQVVCDSSGNIYLTCDAGGAGSLQKYNSGGAFQWAWTPPNDSNGEAIALLNGEIYFSPEYFIDLGGGVHRYLFVLDTNGNVRRTWDLAFGGGASWRVTEIRIDTDDFLYLILRRLNPSTRDFYIYKVDANLGTEWPFYYTGSIADPKPDISFTDGKRVFVTQRYGIPADAHIKLLSELTGNALYEGNEFHNTLFFGPATGTKQMFLRGPHHTRGPKLWLNLTRYNNFSKVPIRDSGCFVNPVCKDYWHNPTSVPYTISKGDILFLPVDSSTRSVPGAFDHGYFRAKENFSAWQLDLFYYAKYFDRLNRVISKPFRLWPFDNAFIYGWMDDYVESYVNALIYRAGHYYRCIKKLTDEATQGPPNATYWVEVPEPDPKWDSFTGFGGLGEYDLDNPEATTPQFYTVVIHGVLDNAGEPHTLNGIYYLAKDLGQDRFSYWRFIRNRPGAKSVKVDFLMFFGIEINHTTGSMTNPTTVIKLQQTWLHEVPAYDGGRLYHVGEGIITHGADGIQHCYTCTQEHSGRVPPDDAYWSEQTEPWDTWSGTYEYLTDDYCLHAGEWYKAKSDHSGQAPPNEEYWTHVAEGDADYPAYKSVYQSDNSEDNYGCMMAWRGAANQGLPDMLGQDGFASVYPGVIYQYNPQKQYSTGDKVVWNGYFYQAPANLIGTEPPTGWQLLGHT